MLPNSQRINRGGLVLTELVETCRNHGFTDVVILHEHRGEPGESNTHTQGLYHPCLPLPHMLQHTQRSQ